MAKKSLTLKFEDDLVDLAQAGADAQGVAIAELMERGESLQGIAHNQLNQALWRLVQRGTYPAALVTEAKEEAARVVAARLASTGAQA